MSIQKTKTRAPTVAGQPLCLVDAGRQCREGAHVGMREPLAHVLLLQIGPLLQIVVNSPWEDSAELMGRRGRKERGEGREGWTGEGGKYGGRAGDR